MVATFEVESKIYSKERPRATIINGYAHIYTPQTTKSYERTILYQAKSQIGNLIKFNDLFGVDIEAHFGIPKSYTKKKRALLMHNPCNNSKDVDNIAKIVLDALNGELYTDDRKCATLNVSKVWDDREYIKVTIYDLASV